MKIETFDLERWMVKYEIKVDYDIAESGIFPLSINELLSWEPAAEREQIVARLLEMRLGYDEGPGTLELRSLLASTYDNCGPENILVTTGAIEANFLLFNVLLDQGDHVIVPYPAYQQLYSVPRAIGCDVSLWRVGPENGFRYDLDELERMLTPATRLIVINTPHNPTGAMLSAEQVQRVYDLAQSVGAMVLGDEAYRWLTIPGEPDLAPPTYNHGPQGISVGTYSKPFGLPGLRVGWLAAPADIVAKCWSLRDYTSLSVGKLDDTLAALALKHREQIVQRNHAIMAQNLATMDTWLAEYGDLVAWTRPRAGLLALLSYNLDMPSLELSNRLAEEYSVMLAPGSAFGYEHYLRIGIGQTPAVFTAGLDRTAACFKDLLAAGVKRRS